MTAIKHTPEPWTRENLHGSASIADEVFADFDRGVMPPARMVVARTYGNSGYGPGNTELRRQEMNANADRIVACINSCAGIEDPLTTVPKMVETLRVLIKANPEIASHDSQIQDLMHQLSSYKPPKPKTRSVVVTFKDVFEVDSSRPGTEIYDHLLTYLSACVRNGDVTGFSFFDEKTGEEI